MIDPITSLLFPDCVIHYGNQREPWWHEIRKDKLTGSRMGAWLADQPEIRATVPEIKAAIASKGHAVSSSAKRDDLLAIAKMAEISLPKTHLAGTIKARHGAVCSILGSLAQTDAPDQWEVDPDGPSPRNPALWAVWNGLRLEKEAVASFEGWSGLEIEEVGFCTHKSGSAGCSPDGLVKGRSIGFEGKAPLAAAHIRYLLGGELPEEYRDQVHGSMAVTGATGWWFQSYCPGLPPFRVITLRDDYTERMAEGLDEFAETLVAAREEIASLWDAEFEGRENL